MTYMMTANALFVGWCNLIFVIFVHICRWIAGLSNIEDPFVCATAVRYVFNASLKDKYANELLCTLCCDGIFCITFNWSVTWDFTCI